MNQADWNGYRMLRAGEIILETDERLYAHHPWHGGNERWEAPQPGEIGTPAPDPSFPAHRMFRRKTEESK